MQDDERKREQAGKPATMKDIAVHLGVSINTVHKAVTGKPGVSDAVRAKILAYAEERGYRRNMEASALRRRETVISACLPALTAESSFFYGHVWDGCRAYADELRSQGIRMVEDAYEEGRFDRMLEAIVRRVEAGRRLDGLLTIPPRGRDARAMLERLADLGVCIVFVSGDEPEAAGRYGAVMADFEVAGMLMAEQARNLLPRGGRILLMAGDAFKDSHYRVARSLHEGIARYGDGFQIHDLYGYRDRERLRADVEGELKEGGVDLVCCVFARGGATLREALTSTGRAGKVPVIASDVFDETVAGMRDGVFTNLVYKDPRGQAYRAMQMLGEHLLLGRDPEQRVVSSEVSLVFQSTLPYFLR